MISSGGTAALLRAAAVLSIVIATLLAATPALAHVSVTVANPRPGATTRYTVSIPNERDDAATVKVEIQLPGSVDFLRDRPDDDWKLAFADGVVTATGATIAPGERGDFAFVARNPDAPATLSLPSIQTYDSGEEVGWIGEPGADNPAPTAEIAGRPVVAPSEPAPVSEQPTGVAGPSASPSSETAAPPAAPSEPGEVATAEAGGNRSNGIVGWLAGTLGAAAVALGAIAFSRSRRSRTGS